MSAAAKSILAFGIYLLLLGSIFLIVPNVGLSWLGLPPTNEPWLRVGGFGSLGLGYYYIQAARCETTVFFHGTLHARPAAAVCFVILVVLRLAPPILLLMGAIDLVGAIWTSLALRKTHARLSSERSL